MMKKKQLALRNAAANATDDDKGKKHLENMKTLVEIFKININAQGEKSKKTALHQAAQRGHCAAVKYLLGNGADVTIEDSNSNTALQLAQKKECNNCVQLLATKAKELKYN